MQFTLLNQENQAYWEATYIEAFPEEERPVSYTHLTLPTILLV